VVVDNTEALIDVVNQWETFEQLLLTCLYEFFKGLPWTRKVKIFQRPFRVLFSLNCRVLDETLLGLRHQEIALYF
jgi:hypothetical protein